MDQEIRELERRLESNADDKSALGRLADAYRRRGEESRAYKLYWKSGLLEEGAPEAVALAKDLATRQLPWLEDGIFAPGIRLQRVLLGDHPWKWPKRWLRAAMLSTLQRPVFALKFKNSRTYIIPDRAPPFPIHSLELNAMPFEAQSPLSQFGSWTCVERLDLGRYALVNEEIHHLSHWDQLRDLSLYGNSRVDDKAFAELPRWPTITRLNLAKTNVSSEVLSLLPSYPKLRHLELSHQSLSNASFLTLRDCPIESLALRYARLDNAVFSEIVQLGGLKELQLTGLSIGDSTCKLLQSLPSLERLSLSSTKISSTGVRWLGPLSQLRHLDLSQTLISGGGLEALSAFPKLESLDLSETKARSRDLQFLEGRSLKTLMLRGLKLSPRNVEMLANMQSLKTLSLWGCGLTDGQLHHLRRVLPQVSFIT